MVLSYGLGEYVASEAHQALLPRRYRADGTVRGVILCSGFGGSAVGVQGDDVAVALAENGVPVARFDIGFNDEFGNATSDSRMDSAWSFAKSRFGFKTDKVLLIGGSHGGCTALNWAKANPTLVAAIALLIPAVDIQDIYDNDRGGFADEVAAAHGGRPPDSRNPADNAAIFTEIPIQAWYSTNDSICIASTVTDFCAEADATATSLGAVGHAITGLNSDDVLSFLGPYVNG